MSYVCNMETITSVIGESDPLFFFMKQCMRVCVCEMSPFCDFPDAIYNLNITTGVFIYISSNSCPFCRGWPS